jgi:hypothetical protein
MGNDNSKSRFDEQYTDVDTFSDANIVKNIASFFTQCPEVDVSYNSGPSERDLITSSLQMSEGPLVVPRSREYKKYKEDINQYSPGIVILKQLLTSKPDHLPSESTLDRETMARLMPSSVGVGATKIEEPSIDVSPQISKPTREPSEFDSMKNEISVSVNEFLEKPAVVGTKFPIEVPAQPQQMPIQQVPTVVIAPLQMQPVQPIQPVQPVQPVQPAQPVQQQISAPQIPEPVFEPPLNSSLTPGAPGAAEQEKTSLPETLAQAGGCPCSQDTYSATSLLSQQGGGSELMNLLPFSSSSGGASDYYRSMQNALRYT